MIPPPRQSLCLVKAKKSNAALRQTPRQIFSFYTAKPEEERRQKKHYVFLLNIYDVLSITQKDCKKALALPNDDFEDALVEVCAINAKADYIISRDERFSSVAEKVKVIKPDTLLDILKE